MKPRRMSCILLPMLAGLAAVGCTPPHEDLQQWMAEQRRQTLPKVTPISEPTRYVPLAYSQQALADPFGKKVAVIDMMDYGMMKGDAVLDKALKMLE